MLVPLYFLIGVWGEGRRVYAAFKFLIYTVVGSFAMLVAILGVAGINFSQTGQLSFDWTVLVQHPVAGVWHLPGGLGNIGIPQLLFIGFALAFAIKMPIFPLHTWLPPAYTASPVPVVIVFAGLVSKLGAYGFLRFNLSLFLVVGMIERRAGTRLRAELRGLGATAPLFAALFLVVSLAALGLPGLNGFVGEF